MILTITVLCLMCIAIGWIGHGLWLKRPVRGERYEDRGCYPINDPSDPDDPVTKALMNGGPILPDITGYFTRTTSAGWGPIEDRWSSPGSGGTVSSYTPDDDSVPAFLSEGGRLIYPHGDHSGPTAMDERGEDRG